MEVLVRVIADFLNDTALPSSARRERRFVQPFLQNQLD
jgi:hypothetical protein